MRNEQLSYDSSSNSNSNSAVKAGLPYFLIGGGIGAIVALLFAPKAGTELRGEIADVTKRGLDVTREKAAELKAQSAETIGTLREKADAIYGYAAERLGKAQDTLDLAALESAPANENDNVQKLAAPANGKGSSRKPSSIM